MNASSIIRIEKLHTMDQVAGAGAHNSRSNVPSHAYFKMLPSNVTLRGGGESLPRLLVKRFQKAGIRVPLTKPGLHRKTRKPRHQRILAFNILCAVGEACFDKAKALAWAERTVLFLELLFGAENVLLAVLHMDERVPHLHVDIAPITPQNKLSAAQIYKQDQANEPEDMGGVRRGNSTVPFLRRLQREFHSLCLEFFPALTEPVPGGVMTHRMVAEWREWIARAHQDMPQLPLARVRPPTVTESANPQAFAQSKVDAYRAICAEVVSTLHAKAVLYDEQVAANKHMQATLQKVDKELSQTKGQLLETQKLFRQMQEQLTGLSLHDLCESLGFAIEPNHGQPFMVLPNGNKFDLTPDEKARDYAIQTWSELSAIQLLAPYLMLTEGDFISGLIGVLPPEQVEHLVAYHDRYMRRDALSRMTGKGIKMLARVKALEPDARLRLESALKSNFGIQKSVLDAITANAPTLSLATTERFQIALQHGPESALDGIYVSGTKFAGDSETLFEQSLGWFQKNPAAFGSPHAIHTVVVSNVIEALSLLSVPELGTYFRIVVSGTTKLENVAAQVVSKPHPVVLIEYGSGRRCGRHRRLREMLQAGNRKLSQLSPSVLRLSMVGFETIALKAQQNPGLGAKLAQLLGLVSSSASVRQTPKPGTKLPTGLAATPPPPKGGLPF